MSSPTTAQPDLGTHRPTGTPGVHDPQGAPVAELDQVSRWYGSVVAVSEVSLALRPGVTALLGPNGAGKSTLLRLVCGLTRPSRGTVRLFGRDPRRHPEVYRHVGIAPQQEALFDSDSPTRFVATAARLSGVADPDTATEQALQRVGLDPDDPRPLRQRSGGERQRAKIAQAIVHRPALLVLDEPVEGLDPRQRLAVLDLVADLGREGRTVLVSSHVLGELDRISDRVLVMAQGRAVAAGTSHGLRELLDDRPLKVRVGTDRPRPLAAALVGLPGVVAVAVEDAAPDDPGAGGAVVVDTLGAPALRRRLAPAAVAVGARLHEVRPLDDDLDSVFRYLVTR